MLVCSSCTQVLPSEEIYAESLRPQPLCLTCQKTSCARCRVPLTDLNRSQQKCSSSCSRNYCQVCQTRKCLSCRRTNCFYCFGSQILTPCFRERDFESLTKEACPPTVCLSCILEKEKKFSLWDNWIVCCQKSNSRVPVSFHLERYVLDYDDPADKNVLRTRFDPPFDPLLLVRLRQRSRRFLS